MFSWFYRFWWHNDDDEDEFEEDEDDTNLASKVGILYIQLFQKLLIPAHVRESRYVGQNPYHRIFYNPTSSTPVKQISN